MVIFDFIIKVMVMIYTTCNVDFFGFGFGFMDLTLGCSLALIIIKFLTHGIPSLSAGTFSGNMGNLFGAVRMSHDKREQQLMRERTAEMNEMRKGFYEAGMEKYKEERKFYKNANK